MSATNPVWPRFVLAILLAPLVPGIVLLIIPLFAHHGLGRPSEGIWVLKFSTMIGYPALIVLGVPAHLVLMKCHWTAWWCYALTGIVIGAIVSGLLFGVGMGILGASLGALTATVFWTIAKPPRAIAA